MTCKPIVGKGFTAIVCSRGKARRAPCDLPGCTRDHAKLCDFPVTRNGQPGTCDAKLCDGHAERVGPNRDYCPAHARLARTRGELPPK